MTAEEVKRLVSILEKIVDTKIQEYALRENDLSPIAFEEKNMKHYTHGMYVDHILFRKFLHEVDLAKDNLEFLETLDERPDVTTADTESLYFVLEDGSLWYIEDGEYKIVNGDILNNIEHDNTLNKNSNPDFLHINEEEKTLITATAGIVSGHTDDIEYLQTILENYKTHSVLTERDAINSHPATAISVTPPSGYTSTDVDGLTKEIITNLNNVGGADIISTNVTNTTGTIVINTTPNWQRVNITSNISTVVLDYGNGILPTKNREYLLVIDNPIYCPTKTLTLPTESFIKEGITYNFLNASGSYPIMSGRSIEVNVIFFFIDATTCNIRTLITPF